MSFKRFDTNIESMFIQSSKHEIVAKKESIILEQLNEFISRGLIVVEETQPVLVEDNCNRTGDKTITIKQAVRLVLKDKEYIEKLEKENKELKASLKELKDDVKTQPYHTPECPCLSCINDRFKSYE